jgi:hypothetical protein
MSSITDDRTRYTPDESVVIIYFASRGLTYPMISDIIRLRCGTDRSRWALSNKAMRIRREAIGFGWLDFYASNRYDLDLTDQWLLGQVHYVTLRNLTVWDRDVIQILRDHVFLPNPSFHPNIS